MLGGEGMLGQMVARVLAKADGIDVKITGRGQTANPLNFNVEDGPAKLHQLIEANGRFDYLVNCIGVITGQITENDSSSVGCAILVNALFPHQLAGVAAGTGARVIHISTDGVFSKNNDICFEDTPQNCDDVYGKTKSLGEVTAAGFLNIRCSIAGPDPAKKRSLLEWFLKQPAKAEVNGYSDCLWNGVTTLQFAKLCQQIILNGSFDLIRAESPVHHFCPNAAVSKYELLHLFRDVFRPDITVKPVKSGTGAVCRRLDTRYNSLKDLFGYGRPMREAIDELAKEGEIKW